jgi:hypothetical protein
VPLSESTGPIGCHSRSSGDVTSPIPMWVKVLRCFCDSSAPLRPVPVPRSERAHHAARLLTYLNSLVQPPRLALPFINTRLLSGLGPFASPASGAGARRCGRRTGTGTRAVGPASRPPPRAGPGKCGSIQSTRSGSWGTGGACGLSSGEHRPPRMSPPAEVRSWWGLTARSR